MNLPQKAVTDYQKLCLKHFDCELTYEDAEKEATEFLEFYQWIMSKSI